MAPDGEGDSGMADFRTGLYGTRITSLTLPLGGKVKLVQFGGDRSGRRLDLAVTPPGIVDLIPPHKPLPSASTGFEIEGKTAGATASIGAFVNGSGTDQFALPLQVRVGGRPRRQATYRVDLLYNLALSTDAVKLQNYEDMLSTYTGAHVLRQNTSGTLNCGDVAEKTYGQLLGVKVWKHIGVLYRTPTSRKKKDLRFDPARVLLAINNIKKLLDQGRPVLLHTVHDDDFTIPLITGTPETHFITVIGYSDTSLMYLDPWPNGSSLIYEGGVLDPRDVGFMGELTWNLSKLELGIRSKNPKAGEYDYVVHEGP